MAVATPQDSDKLLEGDNYTPLGLPENPMVGDVVIWRDKEGNNVHAATVVEADPLVVESKNGGGFSSKDPLEEHWGKIRGPRDHQSDELNWKIHRKRKNNTMNKNEKDGEDKKNWNWDALGYLHLGYYGNSGSARQGGASVYESDSPCE